MTTYVDVPVHHTNTITNIVTNTDTVTNTVTDTIIPVITNHSFTVAEDAIIGTVIGAVRASDDIAVISYRITASNTGYAFSINTNGQLKTIMGLDYDTTPRYSLIVEVADAAGNASNATIAINITDVDAAPIIATIGASGIQNNSVTLNGNLSYLGSNSDGGRQVNEYGFLYSTTVSQADDLRLGKNDVQKVAGFNLTNSGTYSLVIANLPPATPHYFRAFAVNDSGTRYGEVSNFSTIYHQAFTLSGATSGIQSNTVHAQSAHTYSVPLSPTLMYSLTVEANSNVSSSITVYQGANTEPLYIKAGPFSSTPSVIVTATFSGISNGHRYMVLPLNSITHQIVLSNDSPQNQAYALNLREYTGTSPNTRRLPIGPQKLGFFDSTNNPNYFWTHVPANKGLELSLDQFRGDAPYMAVSVAGFSDILFSSGATSTRKFPINSNDSQYIAVSTRNVVFEAGSGQSTNVRLILGFVDPTNN